MKRQTFYLIISLFLSLNSVTFCNSGGQYTDSINDGPYIFKVKHKLKVKWVKNNVLMEDYIIPENFAEIKNKFNLLFDYQDLWDNFLKKSNYSQSYNMVDSISVISDVHGEYSIYIDLLKAMGIIDSNLNWKFGKGHLIVLGDIFDRGDMVTEVLWHLFALEKQAAVAGGMVHVLLGNHEVMVLSKNLFSINEKYKKVEQISDTKYFNLYSKNSVLGSWLRSKPVAISINDIIFVHGGISIEMVKRNLTIMKINQIFSNNIVGKEMMENKANEGQVVLVQNYGADWHSGYFTDTNFRLNRSDSSPDFNNKKPIPVGHTSSKENEEQIFLVKDYGPIWYRGYFTDTNFRESTLDSILNFYNKKHIVVGHTTSEDINSHFNNKIFGVDAGIGNHQPGEMLIYKNGFFYIGYITGNRIKL
jgi:hypothetical protein